MNKALMGQWIVYSSEIAKSVRWDGENKRTSHPLYAFGESKKAMIIGERWLPNGITVRSPWAFDEEDGQPDSFQCESTTHCILAVKDHRTKPIWVDINSAVLLDGTPVKEVW